MECTIQLPAGYSMWWIWSVQLSVWCALHALSALLGPWSFCCWDWGFESRRWHGHLSLVSVVCCQVEVTACGWSPVHRRPTECGVSECNREASTMRKPLSTRGWHFIKKNLDTWWLLKNVFKYLFRSCRYYALEYIFNFVRSVYIICQKVSIILINISKLLSNFICAM
jgi:hypothetical protein